MPPDSAEPPLITELIPVHNHWAITFDLLRSLVAMANATTQLGRQLPWLRIWRSEQNQGFLD